MDDFAKIRMLGYETVPGPGEHSNQFERIPVLCSRVVNSFLCIMEH